MDQYALTQDTAAKRKLVAVGKQIAREAREIVRKEKDKSKQRQKDLGCQSHLSTSGFSASATVIA
jgi:hypothetical protein